MIHNIDKCSEKILSRITSRVPSELKDKLIKIVINSTEEEIAKAAIKAKFISPYKKKKLERMLRMGKFRWEEQKIDDEVAKQIDEFYEREMARARACGTLKDPMTDPFFRARARKLMSRQISRSSPLSGEEKLKAAKVLLN